MSSTAVTLLNKALSINGMVFEKNGMNDQRYQQHKRHQHQQRLRSAKYRRVGLIVSLCSFIFCEFVFILKEPSFALRVKSFTFFVECSQILISYCLLLRYAKKGLISRMIDRMNDYYSYDSPDVDDRRRRHHRVTMISESEIRIKRIGRLVAVVVTLVYVAAFIEPLFRIVAGTTGKSSTVVTLPLWKPWKVNKSLIGYIFGYLMELVFAFSGPLLTQYFLCLATSLSTNWFVDQCDSLLRTTELMKNIEAKDATIIYKGRRNLAWRMSPNPIASEQYESNLSRYDRLLSDLVKRYSLMVENFEIFRSWFEPMYTAKLTKCILQLCLIFYCLIAARDTIDVNYPFFGLNAVCELFFYCYMGEKILSLNDKLRYGIYDTAWYRQPKRNVRTISVLLDQFVNRPMRLRGCLIYSATLATFASTIRSSYSYYSILGRALN